MVLKFETDPNEVYYVDATSTRGVSINKWSTIRKFLGEFYEQIVLRHLETDRDNDLIDKLEVFLKEAVGLKYGISTQKLLFQRTTIKPTKGKYIDENRTFFCSELVAKGYKVLGIINEEDKACSAYYPSSFSSHGKLKVVDGCILGPELNIIVNPKNNNGEFNATPMMTQKR
jgi:AAA+ ATPase superfamily predicted ATPase